MHFKTGDQTDPKLGLSLISNIIQGITYNIYKLLNTIHFGYFCIPNLKKKIKNNDQS